jgi:hypothetical protein
VRTLGGRKGIGSRASEGKNFGSCFHAHGNSGFSDCGFACRLEIELVLATESRARQRTDLISSQVGQAVPAVPRSTLEIPAGTACPTGLLSPPGDQGGSRSRSDSIRWGKDPRRGRKFRTRRGRDPFFYRREGSPARLRSWDGSWDGTGRGTGRVMGRDTNSGGPPSEAEGRGGKKLAGGSGHFVSVGS